mmetsp:Transcript_54606/g.173468  ORF Transcript_54606/g.173468 Transcript_54606/m.173468 type:complete len:222 (-) Transcript_54606:95-760(-)
MAPSGASAPCSAAPSSRRSLVTRTCGLAGALPSPSREHPPAGPSPRDSRRRLVLVPFVLTDSWCMNMVRSEWESARSLRPHLIREFTSKEDLADAIVASCFIPGWLGMSLSHPFRGKAMLDGGFVSKNLMPPTPCDYTIKVSAFPSLWHTMNDWEDVAIHPCISPDAHNFEEKDFWQMIANPSDPNTLDGLYRLGYINAGDWVKAGCVLPAGKGARGLSGA